MGPCNQGMRTKCGIHGKRSCCKTQERRLHDCSIGGYDTCAQPIRCKMDKLFIPSMLCMYGSRCFSHDDPRWSSMIPYDIFWCYVYCLQALCSLLFCLKALFYFIIFLIWPIFAQCTNQDSNCVYAGTNLTHNGWYDTKMIWYGM